ncbi:MAG: anti-sigma factor antagonist [Acidobacteria bacterium]|nr:MAG: anti-sigma factor antagonist [Acidobacteriota bacterium]
MEITREHFGDAMNLIIQGRLDGYWADHLAKELTQVLREGVHQVRLDLAGVKYMSSAGIGMLVQFYKQFEAIQGSFTVINASASVRTLLSLTKLDTLLVADGGLARPAAAVAPLIRQLERGGVIFEIFDIAAGAALKCVTVGDASLLAGCRFREADCHRISFPASTFAVGLGAFGNDFTDCRSRFGEFLSIAGAAAYLPTDGTNVPDYMLAAATFIPELQVLYCAMAEGRFSHLARFDATKEIGAVRLSDLIHAGFEIAGSAIIGVVIVAETAGLLGASLRRSPALEDNGASGTRLFTFPAVREWLSYSAERAHTRSLALVVGIASRNDERQDAGKLFSMLRPLGPAPWPAGHFHAAAFSYRPLKKGTLDLRTMVATLFESENLESVMHLLNDTREISGAGESEFVRGACWFGPISEITERV